MLFAVLKRAWQAIFSGTRSFGDRVPPVLSSQSTACQVNASSQQPDSDSLREADRCFALGSSLQASGDDPGALSRYEQALRLDPRHFWALVSAAGLAHRMGSLEESLALYRRALEIEPLHAGNICVNMGAVLKDLVRVSESRQVLTYAVQLAPNSPEAHYNLGLVLYELAEIADAKGHFEKAIALRPDFQAAQSSLLCLYGLGSIFDPQESYRKHREWARQFADPLAPQVDVPCLDPVRGRRLTIGYVSGDFRSHSMRFFIEPVLANHDRSAFRVICYDNWHGEDEVNLRLRTYVDEWRRIHNWDDVTVAQLVREDRVDILVDLSGHTAGNRLLVFARKPAPIQVTWLGYMCTTGLITMDYRITDAYLDPPGMTEANYSETLFRIPAAATFSPEANCPPVGALPALRNGHVTFISVNNFIKVSNEVIVLWTKILDNVPDARLRLLALGGDEPQVQDAILNRFLALSPNGNIDLRQRIKIQGRRPMLEFLEIFREVDIALDPFPYSGGTTSLHTLWMGVPIVTMEGDSELSRSTSGMIHGCGLSYLVANGESSYLDIACSLAGDLDELTVLREGLRERLAASVIGSAREVTVSVESAFKSMWSTLLEHRFL